jgi:SprA-related family
MIDKVNTLEVSFRQRTMPDGIASRDGGQGPNPHTAPVDRVSLSAEACKAQKGAKPGPKQETELTPEEKQRLDNLRKQDQEVKAHEQAHMAAGGGTVRGAASYQYQTGPDGQQYAVGGEVQIDVSPERSPQATIRKMEQIIRAALAPSEPSSTDRAVAARAAQIEAQARLQGTGEEKAGGEPRQPQASPETSAVPFPQSAYQAAQKTERHAPAGGRVDLMA